MAEVQYSVERATEAPQSKKSPLTLRKKALKIAGSISVNEQRLSETDVDDILQDLAAHPVTPKILIEIHQCCSRLLLSRHPEIAQEE